MILISEFKAWLETLGQDNSIAIDDGGLAIVEIGPDLKPTEAYLEIGGTPEEELSVN